MTNIPTPYDARIAEISELFVIDQDSEAALNHAYDMRRAWRLGYREGHRHWDNLAAKPEPDALDAIAKDMDEEIAAEEHPGQRILGRQVVCAIHTGCDISGGVTKVELEMVKIDAPGFKVEVTDANTGRIRMVPIEAEGFKGEHTGRAKIEYESEHPHQSTNDDSVVTCWVHAECYPQRWAKPTKIEYWPDHSIRLALSGMCKCTACTLQRGRDELREQR